MDITKIIMDLRVTSSQNAPLYLQLANGLAAKIQNFTLAIGTKLPPERELAKLLNVSRTTVINAYRLLEDQGLISTKIGSGSYVNEVSQTKQPNGAMPWEQLFTPQYTSPLSSILRTLIAPHTFDEAISFAAGMPDPAFYPLYIMEKALPSSKSHLADADFGYISTEGYLPLKQSLAKWQTEVGIHATPEQYLIVSGSQQGLYLIVKAFIAPRDYVIVESPTYLGAIQSFENSGAHILTLPPSDRLNFELLEDYLIRYRPKLMYTIPTFQNPTGRVMSLQDRKKLIQLAAKYRLVIVEDDPYSLLYYEQEPPASLKSLDTYGGIIALGTFSKTVFPGLRTGWITAAQQVIDRLAQEKQHIDLHSNNLSQIILHIFLEGGYLTNHLSLIRTEYKKRRDAMVHALRHYCNDYLEFTIPEGGFYIWCKVKPPISVTELIRQSAVVGVTFVPGIAFYTTGTRSNEIRLCFVTHKEDLIKEGIRRLGKILTSGAANGTQTIHTAGRPMI
ncbi:MAG: transcriptional regulator, GntR family with aminotransferase domain containing protein [Massilibacillus sp.]|jgi:DNA-binding transcriptional MocR family regulator|nr:transcriptional regulator, GntR family with aminotransferase domain containing protein [Massilibacillus sp.]